MERCGERLPKIVRSSEKDKKQQNSEPDTDLSTRLFNLFALGITAYPLRARIHSNK